MAESLSKILFLFFISLYLLQFLFIKSSLYKKIILNSLVNLGLFFAGLALIYPLKKYLFGFIESNQEWNLLYFICCLFFLDFITYIWHWLNHKVNFLWQFHKVHHSDAFLDVSSALRFHIFETIPGTCLRFFAFALTQLPIEYFIAYELVFQFFNFYQHSQIPLPLVVNRIFSFVFISPSVHHYHHFIHLNIDKAKNLSTIFSFWDRIFKTYHFENDFVETGLAEHPRKIFSLKELFFLKWKA